MTDEELMLAVCDGDQSAYQVIVRQHLNSISHYAFRVLGNQINAAKWQSEKAKLSTWLHRITHNLCIDYLRKHGRIVTQESFDETKGDHKSNESDNEEITDKSNIKKLNEQIRNLPENQRSALMLCHYQNFSNKEAANIMNISVRALESALARAKRTLRKAMVITDAPKIGDTED
jgi:RNA polymerase sigma-70 factor (ECF subfamily)